MVNSIKREKGDPVIPRDHGDPTGIGYTRALAIGKTNKRFDLILRSVRGYIKENIKPISSASNAAGDAAGDAVELFEYIFGDQEYSDYSDFVSNLLRRALLGSDADFIQYQPARYLTESPFADDWWLNRYIFKVDADAIANAVKSAKYQTTKTATDSDTAQIVSELDSEAMASSPESRSLLRIRQKAAFAEMKSFADGLTSTLTETLRQGIRDGLGQTRLIKKVSQQLIDSGEKGEGTARKKARLIVRNRLNNATRESNRDSVDSMNRDVYADSDYEMRLLWFSALMPTRTRRWHGKRHSKTYTTKEVEQFYSEGGNRYNCYCTQTPILVYKETGEPVTDTGLIDKMKKQRELFDEGKERTKSE